MRVAVKLLLGGTLLPLLAACDPYPADYNGAPAYLQSSVPQSYYYPSQPDYAPQPYYANPGYTAPFVVVPGGREFRGGEYGRERGFERHDFRPDERYRGRPEQFQQRQPQFQQQQFQPQRPPPQAPRQMFSPQPQPQPQPQSPRIGPVGRPSDTSSGERQ